MVRTNGFNVAYAAVVQFESISGEGFVQRIWFRELLIYERKEVLPSSCF